MEQKTLGVLAILAAAIMWAIEPILAKLSYQNSSVMHTLAIRVFVITLIAFLYQLATKSSIKVEKQKIPVLVYIAIVATLIGEFVYLYALTKVPIINVVLLGHTQPLFIVLIAYFYLKEEKLTKYDYIGIFLMIIASIIVASRTFENLMSFKGFTIINLLIVVVAFGWATAAIAVKKYLKDFSAGAIVFYRYGISAVVLLFYIIYKKILFVANIYQILIGVVIGIGIILYYESLKRIKAAQVSALELASPFFAAFLGFIFFKETITLMQVTGIIMLSVGVYFLSKKEI